MEIHRDTPKENVDDILSRLTEKELLILILKNVVKIENQVNSIDYALKEMYGDFYTNLLEVPEAEQGNYNKLENLLPSTILLNNLYENTEEFEERGDDLVHLKGFVDKIRSQSDSATTPGNKK